MSSALSDIDAFPAHSGGLRNEARDQKIPSPFLGADVPWPETPDYARPEPWLPESGEYRFVPEEIVRQLESLAPGLRQEYQRYIPPRVYTPAPPPLWLHHYGYY